MTTTLAWVLPGVPLGQSGSGFFDHQYPWKE